MTDYQLNEELDRIANNTRLTDVMLATNVIDWSKKRGLRVIDAVAVAYRMGYVEGRKSNQERINKAFLKLYPDRATGKAPTEAEAVDVIQAVNDGKAPVQTGTVEAAIEPAAVPAADTGNADPQLEELEPVTNDVITPNGNEEVEHNAEPEE